MHSTGGAGIEYLTGTKVESVDIKNKTLKIASGGEDITYDKLIIATGSTVSCFAYATSTLVAVAACVTDLANTKPCLTSEQFVPCTCLAKSKTRWLWCGCRT